MRTPAEILCNFHWIYGCDAARSSQGLGLLGSVLKKNRIRSLVNLRGRHPHLGWWRREATTCARLGVARYDVVLDSRLLPTREMLTDLLDAFEAAPTPILVKCSGGQDRAALGAAIFILLKSGWNELDNARRQFARLPYLHFPHRTQGWLAQFPAYAASRAQGRSFATFIRESYEPEDFAAWLRNQNMGDRFSGIFSLPWRPHASRFKFW